MADEPLGSVYQWAEYYDIAFDFRDVGAECDFLCSRFEAHGGGAGSFLELACGPGQHVVEMAGRGVSAAGLDLSPDMLGFLQEKAAARGVEVHAIEADMRSFRIPDRFHGAALLMDSASHLLTHADMIDHLRSVARHLETGGVYVLEMSHPSNHLGVARTTRNVWTMERDRVVVETEWGQPDDPFDSLTQVDEVTVVLRVTEPGREPIRHTHRERIRRWLKPEFEAAVEMSGAFEIVEWYGSLDRRVALGHEKAAWRMVPVLRKISAEGFPAPGSSPART